MNTPHRTQRLVVVPNRLFAAADMLLEAIESPDGFDSLVSIHAGPRQVGCSRSPAVFNSEEVIEAMAMLIRMGLVPGATHRAPNPLLHTDSVQMHPQ